jgi:hypothetical protein
MTSTVDDVRDGKLQEAAAGDDEGCCVRVACEDALHGRASANRGTATSADADDDLGGTQTRRGSSSSTVACMEKR